MSPPTVSVTGEGAIAQPTLSADAPAYKNPDLDFAARARDLVSRMTVEEKIGQLFINLNTAFTPEYLDHILESYHIGGMRFRGVDAASRQKE